MKKTFPTIIAATLAFAPGLRADTALQTSAYRNSIAQDEVRKQAEEVRQQLILLLEDIQQNQMQTGDLSKAEGAANRLASLSEKEIAPLVEMLKGAGGLDKVSEVSQKLAEASQGQKNVQLHLKTLADQLLQHKNQASMEQRLQQLVLRQTTNLRQTGNIAKAGDPKKLPAELVTISGVCQSEQTAIGQEVTLTLSTLETVVAGMPENERAGFAAALEESRKLAVNTLAQTATQETGASKWPEAATAQGRLRDALQLMVLKLKTNQAVPERLAEAANKLQQLATEQQKLAEATEKAKPEAQKELREAQNKLSDQVAALNKEVASLNAKAADTANKAEDDMKKAEQTLQSAKSLKDNEKKEAAEAQKKAAEKLAAASESMQNQAKELAKNTPQNAAAAMQSLAQLDQKLKETQARQNALNTQPPPPNAAQQQQALAEQTAAMQQQAMALNPEAASKLGEAAAQMQQSPADAAKALAEANAEIQKQMQDLRQAAALQQSLQAISSQIAAAKNDTNQAGQMMKGSPQDLTPAIKQMEAAEQKLAQAQSQAGPNSAAPADVQKALADAKKSLSDSRMSAAQLKKDAANSANAAAQASMQKAMQSIASAVAQAQAQAMGASPGQSGQSEQQASQQNSQNQQSGQVTDGKSGSGMTGAADQFLANAGTDMGAAQVNPGLKPKDRAAITMLQKEKAPAEYQGMVQQYLKNLAEGVSPGKASD